MKILKTFFVPALMLCAICLVMTALLAFTNDITEPRIEALAEEAAKEARLEVLPHADHFGKETKLERDDFVCVYQQGLNSKEQYIGYVFTVTVKGYGGEIKVMTGIGHDGFVKGVSILDISETPGLGMHAKDDSFLEQYLSKNEQLVVSKDAKEFNEIDAISGATITSRAVTSAVNAALAVFEELGGVNGNG